jgi:hypothetical protein
VLSLVNVRALDCARFRLPVALLAALALFIAASTIPAASASAADAGAVQFVKRTGPEFDQYMNNPTASFSSWMRAKFWRSEVFTPYFDNKTSWYNNGWVYEDSYSIYPSSPNVTAHPDWILKDGGGNKLYIPWGCSNGTCPQYAADIGNPAYRAWWISQVKAAVAHGYKGVWVDDVNMDMQVGNGQGANTAPLDPRTGTTMTTTAWRSYMATFMEELRAAVPNAEILHNSVWYAVWGPRDTDPYVQRQIRAADYINIERGVNDDGLTGGTGEWSLNALLGYVDRVHAAGKGVIFDGFDAGTQGREYNLAAYYLMSTGNDGVGLGDETPDNWWSMYDVDLGNACGNRAVYQGVDRRDFAGGIVLLNEPGAPTRTVTLPQAMTDSSGARVTQVTLSAHGGAVLRGTTSCTPAATTPAPVVVPVATGGTTVTNAPATGTTTTTPPVTTTTPTTTTRPVTTTTTTTTTRPVTTTTTTTRPVARKPVATRPVRHTRITSVRITRKARVARKASTRARSASTSAAASVLVTGQVATGVKTVVSLQVKRHGRFTTVSSAKVALNGDGTWAYTSGVPGAGSYRVVMAAGTTKVAKSFTT